MSSGGQRTPRPPLREGEKLPLSFREGGRFASLSSPKWGIGFSAVCKLLVYKFAADKPATKPGTSHLYQSEFSWK